jgi:hypothetical protein
LNQDIKTSSRIESGEVRSGQSTVRLTQSSDGDQADDQAGDPVKAQVAIRLAVRLAIRQRLYM